MRLPDEALGLSAGWLLAGAAGVVATLWPIDDLAAALLVARFYAGLDPTADSIDPAAALARAQVWLDNLSTSEVLETAGGNRLVFDNVEPARRARPLGVARQFVERFERFEMSGPDRPFAHPLLGGLRACWSMTRRARR